MVCNGHIKLSLKVGLTVIYVNYWCVREVSVYEKCIFYEKYLIRYLHYSRPRNICGLGSTSLLIQTLPIASILPGRDVKSLYYQAKEAPTSSPPLRPPPPLAMTTGVRL